MALQVQSANSSVVCGGRTRGCGLSGKSRQSSGLVRTGDRLDPQRAFEFVKANRAEYPVAIMCRLLEVSTSGYYAWLKRPPSRRAQEHAALTERIRAIHSWSRRTHGAFRIFDDQRSNGVRIGRKRVARLMRAAGLRGISRRKKVRNRTAKALAVACPGPGGSGLQCAPSRRALDRWHHLHPHRCRLSVHGGGGRCFQPAGGGLGHGQSSAHRAGPGRAQHGHRTAAAGSSDPSFGPGQPIHLAGLREAVP